MYYDIEGTGDPIVCIPPAVGFAGLKRYPAVDRIDLGLREQARAAAG